MVILIGPSNMVAALRSSIEYISKLKSARVVADARQGINRTTGVNKLLFIKRNFTNILSFSTSLLSVLTRYLDALPEKIFIMEV